MGVERALDSQQEDSGLNGLDLRPRALFSKKSTGKDPFCWLFGLFTCVNFQSIRNGYFCEI